MLCVCCVSVAKAQDGEQGSTADGYSVSFYFPTNRTDNMNWSYNMGFEMNRGSYIADNVFVISGLGYLMSSQSIDIGNYNSLSTTSDNLCLPINIGSRLPLGGNDFPLLSVYTGPYLTYAIAGYVEKDVPSSSKPTKTRFSEMDDVQRFYAYWRFGATLNITGDFGIDFQYMTLISEHTGNSGGIIGIGIGLRY